MGREKDIKDEDWDVELDSKMLTDEMSWWEEKEIKDKDWDVEMDSKKLTDNGKRETYQIQGLWSGVG